jgi:hypothetical protein
VSSISRWSYANLATVWPYVGEDDWQGGVSYGTPYQIACTWTAKSEQRRDKDGAEFTTRSIYWSEDARPKYRDRIAQGTHSGAWDAAEAEEVRSVTSYDMSPFGEADFPDYELAT